MPIDWQPLKEIVESHQRFVITSHVRPDADAIGSEIGLAELLVKLGKDVRIVNPSATPNSLSLTPVSFSVDFITFLVHTSFFLSALPCNKVTLVPRKPMYCQQHHNKVQEASLRFSG